MARNHGRQCEEDVKLLIVDLAMPRRLFPLPLLTLHLSSTLAISFSHKFPWYVGRLDEGEDPVMNLLAEGEESSSEKTMEDVNLRRSDVPFHPSAPALLLSVMSDEGFDDENATHSALPFHVHVHVHALLSALSAFSDLEVGVDGEGDDEFVDEEEFDARLAEMQEEVRVQPQTPRPNSKNPKASTPWPWHSLASNVTPKHAIPNAGG